MPGYYDAIDFKWDDNGDYLIGKDGDFAITDTDTISSLSTEIKTIIASDTGDWEMYRSLAADLKDFIGEPNIREVGKRIEDRIKNSIVLSRLVESSDIKVRVTPLTHDSLMIIVIISATSTVTNSLETNGQLTIPFIFDMAAGGITFKPAAPKTNYFPVKE
jgi:hypothetical protein